MSVNWDKKQLNAARELYGSIVDIKFPEIPPESGLPEIKNLVTKYTGLIDGYFSSVTEVSNAVHLMGEFTFTYNLVEELRKKNITVIASTTKRNIVKENNGSKISQFQFVRFRNYY